jgi:hypothetical protein
MKSDRRGSGVSSDGAVIGNCFPETKFGMKHALGMGYIWDIGLQPGTLMVKETCKPIAIVV